MLREWLPPLSYDNTSNWKDQIVIYVLVPHLFYSMTSVSVNVKFLQVLLYSSPKTPDSQARKKKDTPLRILNIHSCVCEKRNTINEMETQYHLMLSYTQVNYLCSLFPKGEFP